MRSFLIDEYDVFQIRDLDGPPRQHPSSQLVFENNDWVYLKPLVLQKLIPK